MEIDILYHGNARNKNSLRKGAEAEGTKADSCILDS